MTSSLQATVRGCRYGSSSCRSTVRAFSLETCVVPQAATISSEVSSDNLRTWLPMCASVLARGRPP